MLLGQLLHKVGRARGIRHSPGIETEGPNTALIDDRIVTEQVLAELELHLPPIAALYMFHLSLLGNTEEVARRFDVSPQMVRLALGLARRTAKELLVADSRFAESVRDLGFDTMGQ